MTEKIAVELREILRNIEYHEGVIQEIIDEITILIKEMDTDLIKKETDSAIRNKDNARLIDILSKIMVFLEKKGIYRPDIPGRLPKLLINSLNQGNENIFSILKKADIPDEIKKKEAEFLVSCAAITQIGYILINYLVSDAKVGSAGSHVFLIMDCFSSDTVLFIDISIESIRKINIKQMYNQKGDFYFLKDKAKIQELDHEIYQLLTEYYSFFQITTKSGLSYIILNNLGIVYDTIGRSDMAIAHIKAALKLNPKYIEAHNNLAVMYHKTGRSEDAITRLQKVLVHSPEYSQGYCNLGFIYADLNRDDEAITQINEAIKYDPDLALAHNLLGNIYAEQNRSHEAVAEFQEALKINPDYSHARNNLGHVFYELGRYEEAVKEFQEAIRLDPQFIEAHQGIGSALYDMDKYDKAAHSWAKAVYLKPELMKFVPETIKLKVTMSLSRLKFSN
ncbi:MAG: tetratricopeptide repeat protein [Methanosarcinales archaeon]|nr:tetratricopeptide repeat protein [Methanosarcinales archaeon]